MRRILAAAAAALLAASCGAPRTAPERKGRTIVITNTVAAQGGTDTVRFGRMRSGEIGRLPLWIENASERATAILSYQRSCGCTTLEFDAEPLVPGEARRASLTLDTRGERGWMLKTLDLKLAGAERPLRIFVEAEVE